MSEIDFLKIKQRITEIEEALVEIKKYTAADREKFFQDHRNILAVEQLLLKAIEAVGGICLHLVAKKLKKGTESIGHCFELLKEAKLTSDPLADNLIKMARFRNLLIHQYWKIDEEKVYEYAIHNLTDFEKFIEEINQVFNL